MDEAIVSDLLVEPDEAKKIIQDRMTRLELCSNNETQLADWFDATLDALDAAFATSAREYFYKNGGFTYSYFMGHPKELVKANRERAAGILKRMRDAVPNHKSQPVPLDVRQEVPIQNTKIFVVHGHDEGVKERLISTLAKLELQPIVINELANSGMTIIEKIEHHGEVGFAVVAFTSDDKGAANSDAETGEFEDRPRQNVLLELGYFWGKLGRGRVCLLNSIGSQLSSDLRGLGYTDIDGAGHWKFELVKELKAAGYDVDANKLI